MAHPPDNTYMYIPPPPLPEFYLSQQKQSTKSSASCIDNGARVSELRSERIVEAHPASTLVGDGTDTRWAFNKSRATRPQFALQQGDEPSPLAVYHICRICLRPRSARYHREHPIPINGLPPPPGICRRCRVTSVDEARVVTEITEEPESSGVKLGLKCLIPDEDYFTNEEIRSKRAGHTVAKNEWAEVRPAREESQPREQEGIIYRHVHIAVPPPPPRPLPPRTITISKPRVQNMVGAASEIAMKTAAATRSSHLMAAQMKEQYELPRAPPLKAKGLREIDSTEASMSTHASTTTKSKHMSYSRHRSTSLGPYESGHTESEIRGIARDEVERYRQAERKIEAHRNAYAHGKLIPVESVPVERRIELQRDVADEMPWKWPATQHRKVSALETTDDRSDRWNSVNKREEVLVVQHNCRQSGHEEPWPPTARKVTALHADPPSNSSDKTRWPEADSTKTPRKCKSDMKRNVATGQKSRKYKVIEIVQGNPVPEQRLAKEDANRQVHDQVFHEDTRKSSMYRQSSRSTDREYWECDQPARNAATSHASRRMEIDHETDQHQPSAIKYSNCQELREPARQQSLMDEQSLGRMMIPPYPRENAPVPMPSPQVHMTKPRDSPTNGNVATDGDNEYVYVRRTVQPVDHPVVRPANDSHDFYYKETEECLHRRKATEKRLQQQPVGVGGETKRRPSDVSSRVRFCKKVDVSPTPPGSDADSAQFRNFGRRIGRTDGPHQRGQDLIAEYERRGRTRSREPDRGYGFYHERDSVHPKERGRYRAAAAAEADADRYRISHLAGREGEPRNHQTKAIHSESPAEKRLLADARRQRSEGYGPYAMEEKRSVSVDVEDGSTMGSGNSSDRDRREHRGQGRQRSKR